METFANNGNLKFTPLEGRLPFAWKTL